MKNSTRVLGWRHSKVGVSIGGNFEKFIYCTQYSFQLWGHPQKKRVFPKFPFMLTSPLSIWGTLSHTGKLPAVTQSYIHLLHAKWHHNSSILPELPQQKLMCILLLGWIAKLCQVGPGFSYFLDFREYWESSRSSCHPFPVWEVKAGMSSVRSNETPEEEDFLWTCYAMENIILADPTALWAHQK